MTLEDAISLVTGQANRLRSIDADFEKNTWTFTAPYMRVGAGEYVVIPYSDWVAFVSNLRASKEPT
ncbi:MAG: hypothetical protein ABL964_09820 [Steroidobacteraceae bacterium]